MIRRPRRSTLFPYTPLFRPRRADGNGKLKIGVDIPAPAEMRAIVGKLDTAAGRHGPLLLTAIFTGLRASADRKSTRLNSSHSQISYAVFCLKKKKDYMCHRS